MKSRKEQACIAIGSQCEHWRRMIIPDVYKFIRLSTVGLQSDHKNSLNTRCKGRGHSLCLHGHNILVLPLLQKRQYSDSAVNMTMKMNIPLSFPFTCSCTHKSRCVSPSDQKCGLSFASLVTFGKLLAGLFTFDSWAHTVKRHRAMCHKLQ